MITNATNATANGVAEKRDIRMLKFENPATGEAFGQMPMSTAGEVAQARQEMEEAAAVWTAKPIKERARIIRQLQAVIIDSVDEITARMNQDSGKTRQDALIEVFISVDIINQYVKNAPKWLRRERVSPGVYFFRRYFKEKRPYGTVAVIAPWNYPFVLVVPPMVAALMAGNTVLLKPSEVTAATGLLVEQLIKRVPELTPFVRVLHGDGAVGAAVVKSEPDLIFLTGSTGTGRKVLQAAAETLTPVITELGGKDPMLVLDDADLEAAAHWGAWGAFFNSGQTCMAVERIYAVESVYDEFLRRLLAATDRLKMGYTTEKEGPYHLGPLTFERQVRIIDDHLQDALEKGAIIVRGGQRRGLFMEPTVLVNVDHSMKIMREETFGPILPVMKVGDEAEAIRLANDSSFGLSASVWSSDIAHGERVAGQIRAGTKLVNDVLSHFAVPHLPFGGIKHTGTGSVHGRQDILQFTYNHSYSIGGPPMPFDVATQMRLPGRYWLGKLLVRLLFGVTPAQRLAPVTEALSGLGDRANDRTPVGKAALIGGLAAGTAAVILGYLRGRK